MRTGITIQLNPIDRKRLLAVIDNRNSAQKHVWRAKIVLATADGLGTAAIMRTAGVSKTAVWRWQERFMALTLGEPPGEATHWTGRGWPRSPASA